MLKTFRTYQLAIILYRQCKEAKLPTYLKDIDLESRILDFLENTADQLGAHLFKLCRS